jgi:hypothetical protein
MERSWKRIGLASAVALLVAGCAGSNERVSELEQENERLRAELQASEADATMARSESMQTGSDGSELYPPNARPGECYARVLAPPQYKTETRTITVSEASERLETLPAQYEWAEERVLVKEAEEKLEVIPARYEWREERILVKPEHRELVAVPAQYNTVSEQILVKPAYTTWKKGRGPIERVDNATGEIMCLVEVPAEYKTVTKRVQTSPPTTREVVTPAEYKTVRKKVMVEGPKTRTITIPEEYETIRVRKLVKGPEERRIEIPAEYSTVSEEVLVKDAELEWRPILCETNTTPDVIRKVQVALQREGYNPGPIDGELGPDTMRAVRAYQRDNNMHSGQLTMETLYKLGVMPRPVTS